MTYRILVTGSRDWDRDDVLAFQLGVALGEAPTMLDVVIVHGVPHRGGRSRGRAREALRVHA